MPNIALINESAGVADEDVRVMLPALDLQWNRDLRAVWDVAAASFAFLPNTHAPPVGSWWVVLLDNGDQASALAYHDLTNEGLPLATIFVDTLRADGASISVGASHDICEMAVDPWLNSAYQDPAGRFWACDVCDPVRDDEYGYRIGEVLVSDFVTPNWFGQPPRGRVRMDLGEHAETAFQILSGGYAQYFEADKGWVQVADAKALHSVGGKTAARGSRRERRARQAAQPLTRSQRLWPDL